MNTNERKRALWRVAGGLAGLVAMVGVAGAWGEPAPRFVVQTEAGPVEAGEVTIDGFTIDPAMIRQMMGGAGGGGEAKSDGKSWKEVSKDFEKVISTSEDDSLYSVWINRKTNQALAELPRGYASQKHFFAMTVSGGELFAGLQAGDLYAQWRKYDNRLALIVPQMAVRSSGDQESKDSVEMIFTDRVLLDVPIVCDGPSGQPVIDLDGLLVGKADKFFGRAAAGLSAPLTTFKSVKAFPQNIEVELEGPVASGTIKQFHYSISRIQGTPGYKPREADNRVGYFTTSYRDLGKFDRKDVDRRLINRWNLEKADPKLKVSPPKQPIVFYVEHTVPVRYRRFVREGIEYWNDAYRAIGIEGAIEVRYQDKRSGSHMEKDPEDVRYNFIRWLSNDIGTAIGPSRVNPETGEILDADVVLTDGWIRAFTYRWNDLIPKLALEGMSPQTLDWLERNPKWDPRVRMAPPEQRGEILAQRARRGVLDYGGNPVLAGEKRMLGDHELDGLAGRVSQVNGLCMAASGKALDLAIMRMYMDSMIAIKAANASAEAAIEAAATSEPEIDPAMLEMLKKQLEENPELAAMIPAKYRAMLEGAAEEPEGEEPEGEAEAQEPKKEDEGDLIDGMPEEYIGPALAELVAHEVGHTLGLRHNFKASGHFSLAEINSEEIKGKKPWSMSVMDYNGMNLRMPGDGDVQGDYSVIDIGPYDYWAIEYGYGFGDPKKVAARAAEPELQYGTDEDTWGPDPFARRYDMTSEPLEYAQNQMKVAKALREQLLTEFVKDGDSWAKARQGYLITLGQQIRSVSMMANWVGSAFVYRDKKGDPDGRPPIEVVPAARQRAALKFVCDTSFNDASYGLTPETLRYLTVDKWWDDAGLNDVMADATFPLHDRILGAQAATLTMLMNGTTLQRVFDLEAFVPAGEDALTLPEVFSTVSDTIWSELDAAPGEKHSAREPMISSLRRNLQREHLDRLIDLSMLGQGTDAGEKPVKQLATQNLRDLSARIETVLSNGAAGKADPYTRAHLTESKERIAKALDAAYIYNLPEMGMTVNLGSLFGQDGQPRED